MTDESSHSLRDRGQPIILLFGDSHTHAVHLALGKRLRKGLPAPVQTFRARVEKNGKIRGDTPFEDFLAKAALLGPDDLVLSMIGGNRHAVFSTIQHPQRFDFYPFGDGVEAEHAVEIIPRRALETTFAEGIADVEGGMLEKLRERTAARLVHLLPPPPKRDNAFIKSRHESYFARQGIVEMGVSPPELRLKFWELYAQVLTRFCRARKIKVMEPPPKGVQNGYLREDCYGSDSTHANARYGELVLRRAEKQYIRIDVA